jgi:hypothetical protein
MPIIAGRASAAYGAGFGAITTPPYQGPFGAYDALATVIVPSGGLASVTFTGIPTGYKHLQIRSVLINTAGASGNFASMIFNDDSSAVYSWHLISGNGSATATNNLSATTAIRLDQGIYSNNSNTSPQITVCDILDYGVTNKYKTTRALDGGDANGAGFASMIGGAWYNFSAINTIKLSSLSAGTPSTFGQHSHIALYGVK